ncbi:hypothetical protein M758_6G204700 [Ceratodon purpureus]|nr:hypothetical protein M758_6G204700 [Ceratodon purpureus]
MAANSRMSSPYATMADMPIFEKRADAVLAPWLKDEPAVLSGRSHDPDAFMPCNSQTAPFATFHNVPRSLEYVGPLPEAPWNKDIPVHPTHRGQRPEHQYHYTTPFATSDNSENHQRQTQNSAVVEDAPWDKKLPAPVPGRGSGVHEHSMLPSSQTAPFATNSNFEEQKQYDGPMPDAPWDKDQRPAYQQKVSSDEYFKNVPYATSENMDRQAKSTREIDVAPWNKSQPAVVSGKGNEYYISGGSANSHTAPYATFDNNTTPPPNRTAGFQAPWDRDEVHCNRPAPRFLQCSHGRDDGPFNAPYATDRG